MELDDLKSAWQDLNATMAHRNALDLRLLRERQGEKAQRRLRPIRWGQALQIIGGALLALFSGTFWTRHLHVPHLLITGLFFHLYGIALIILGARTQTLISAIDFGAPVVEIQKRLARLRRFYIVGGLWLGLPWLFLWLPFGALVFTALTGVDVMAKLPLSLTLGNTAFGLGVLLVVLALPRLLRSRPEAIRRLESALAGPSLAKAQAALDEIARFEAE